VSEKLREKGYSDLDADFRWPSFCPLCARPLEFGSWVTTTGDYRYDYACCFGGSWLAWWARLVSITVPRSAHYLFQDIAAHPTMTAPAAHDRQTGAPLR
jgi:hypothetical protein